MVNLAEKEMLETISAIATLVTPFLIAVLGGIGWLIQRRLEASQAKQDAQVTRIRELEDKLREDRISTYNSLLEPFFLLSRARQLSPRTRSTKARTRMS